MATRKHVMIAAMAAIMVAAIGMLFSFETQNKKTLAAKEINPVQNASTLKPQVAPIPPSAHANTLLNSSTENTDYMKSYQNLYMTHVDKVKPNSKTVYLTFDDGPSSLTEPLLNVLDKYNVKATFFVVAAGSKKENCAKWMKDIVNRGHVIALHSYTHNYNQIYASTQAYFDDFAKMYDFIEQSTGQKITMFRFPGGSVNSFNKKTCKSIITEMTRRGYTYYDWNVSSGDAIGNLSGAAIYRNVIKGVHANGASVVLMHNSATKRATLSQVGNIITTLRNQGYHFDTLNPTVSTKPFNFRVPDA